jgi:HK97 gp10 family phage protein
MISLKADDQLSTLLNALSELESVMSNKVVRSGLVALSKPIKKSMAAHAPRNQGYLAQSINHKSLTKRQKSRLSMANGDVALLIGPNKKVNGFSQSRKANLVEHGVKAHDITSKGKPLTIGGSGFAVGKIKHPGIKADPFMANALQDNESNVSGLFYQGMAKSLDRIRAQ